MAGQPRRLVGPVALSNTLTTNILNGGGGVSAVFDVITHIHIVNKTAGAVSFSLWLGATGGNVAGTEVIGTGRVIAANTAFDWYGRLRLDSTDFLVGGAGAATSLTLTASGERHAV